MKKLIVAITLSLAIGIANAASIDWKVTGTSAQKNYSVYLLTSVADSYTSAAEIADAAISSGVIAKSGVSYGTGVKYVTDSRVTTDTMKNAFFVLVGSDTSSYTVIAKDLSGSVYDTSAQQASPGTFSATVSNLLAAGTTKSFVSVPEPTSGLLLLVGMAGLALRRKQK